MSEHVYAFRLGIGYPSAERYETFDLVDDLGYDEDDLDTEDEVNKALERELEEWQWQYIETWTEKQ